jgi:hypothetical protein
VSLDWVVERVNFFWDKCKIDLWLGVLTNTSLSFKK